jgi:thiol-disulfide isomerase/thioredoxin
MRKLIYLVVVLLVVLSCGSRNDDKNKNEKNLTVITGKIENARDKVVTIIYNTQTDTVSLNENGEFTAKLLLSEPAHVVVVNGINHARIYAFPQTKIKFSANYEDFNSTIKFEGDNPEVNTYLAKQVKLILGLNINSEKFLYAPDYSTFSASLKELSDGFNKNLSEFESKHSDYADFVILEKERLKVINGTLLITFYTPLINVKQKRDEIEADLDQIIASTDLNNPQIIEFYEFRQYAQNLVAYKLNKKLRDQNIELTSAESYAKEYFVVLEELFFDKVILEELYYHFMKDFMAFYGAETVLEQYSRYKQISANKKRLGELDKIFSEYDKLSAGNPSVEWSFPDANEKIYSLSSFRGKYVYIDVWASWCGPCKQEIPHFKSLKEKFKGRNIEFVAISVDESKKDWLSAIESSQLTGIQLWAAGWENPLCDFFKITGIPRFILIDKNGKIINANADRPSGDIEEVLNNLEGI